MHLQIIYCFVASLLTKYRLIAPDLGILSFDINYTAVGLVTVADCFVSFMLRLRLVDVTLKAQTPLLRLVVDLLCNKLK